MASVRWNFDYNSDEFKAKFRSLMDRYDRQMVQILRYTAPKASEQASKYTFPMRRNKSGKVRGGVELDLYYRPIGNLRQLVIDRRATQQELQMFRKQGIRWYVQHMNSGQTRYFKKLSQAHRDARIHNRGLAKWSWGSGLAPAQRPNAFEILRRKSPNLGNLTFNTIRIFNEGDYTLDITNTSQDINSAGALAPKFAERKAVAVINNRLRQMAHKEQTL